MGKWVVSEDKNSGLGLVVTCTCPDFQHRQFQAMDQMMIEKRWMGAKQLTTDFGKMGFGRSIACYKAEDGTMTDYELFVSRGDTDPGATAEELETRFVCKHGLALLRDVLEIFEGVGVLGFGLAETPSLPTFKRIDVNGWLHATGVELDED